MDNATIQTILALALVAGAVLWLARGFLLGRGKAKKRRCCSSGKDCGCCGSGKP